MPQQIAFAYAHKIASALIQAGIVPPEKPITGAAKLECHGLQVIVTIAAYEPATISAETLAKIDAMKSGTPYTLTPTQSEIVKQLSKDRPTKASVIAIRTGRKLGGSFRGLLADMVRFGVIRKVKGGYVLA